MLSIRGLRKRYGDVVAMDGIDLDVRPGETFGLLGPNGAGKSTTIQAILGIVRPDAGEVSIGERGHPDDPAVRGRIGYAPQDIAVYEELTGLENLRFFGRLQGLRSSALGRAVDRALGIAGFDRGRAGKRVAGYSGGMKRRLNLVCAALHEPALLLLDEPTVGVDPQSRNHLLTTIEAMADAGTTVLYTTHYMEEAQRLCSRVAVMDRGRILACDTVSALIAAHGGRSSVEVELGSVGGDPGFAAVEGAGDAAAQAPGHRGSDGKGTSVDHDATMETGRVLCGDLPGPVTDGVLRFEADDAMDAVRVLESRGIHYRSLHVRRPDLETVFLELTGRRLRDA